MDLIELHGIKAYGKHGANPGERDEVQPFDVDVSLEINLAGAQRTDDLEQTLNYAALHESILRIIREHSYLLLERLAGAIIDEVFLDARVAAARVRVGKPGLLDGATPSVSLRRDNPRFVAQWP
ncbi:MAG: dihydroneopterin aldolase [Candidatus Eremiobacteraeota bacterium]|nr:dihydroneopterin aldolase [Candidatus Eremiobacteraeota bacterium]